MFARNWQKNFLNILKNPKATKLPCLSANPHLENEICSIMFWSRVATYEEKLICLCFQGNTTCCSCIYYNYNVLSDTNESWPGTWKLLSSSWCSIVSGVQRDIYLYSALAYTRPPPRDILSIPFHRKHGSDPEQVHTSLAGDKKMRITWITYDANVPSIVEYGTSPGYILHHHWETTIHIHTCFMTLARFIML